VKSAEVGGVREGGSAMEKERGKRGLSLINDRRDFLSIHSIVAKDN
jgi:hypothetical protein